MDMEKTPRGENKMGVLPEGRLLAGMAVPMMISMLVQALYNVVDSVFVAMLSQDAMNAVSLAFPLQTLMIAAAGGTGVGMNALVSRSLGEKRQEFADRAANVGIFLNLCSAVLFAVIGITAWACPWAFSASSALSGCCRPRAAPSSPCSPRSWGRR